MEIWITLTLLAAASFLFVRWLAMNDDADLAPDDPRRVKSLSDRRDLG